MNKDYYQILELNKDASPEKIKENYRRLAKRYHPDVNKDPGAEEKFKEIQEAYSVLSDPEKKSNYDRFGSANAQAGDGGFPFGFNPFSNADTWQAMYNTPIKEQGEKMKITVTMSLKEMYEGIHKKIKAKKYCTCHRCHGTGSATNETTTCPKCNGTGHVTEFGNGPFGRVRQIMICPECNGIGHIIKDPCPACDGTGRIYETADFEFDIPAGIPDEACMTLHGQGHAGPHQGIPGDLYIIVSQIPDDKGLKREKDDLLYNLDVKLTDLIYGADVEVPWIDGYKKIHISPGTQNGKTFTRFNEGFPNVYDNSRKGNYKITVNSKIPSVYDLHGKDRENFDRIKAEGNY